MDCKNVVLKSQLLNIGIFYLGQNRQHSKCCVTIENFFKKVFVWRKFSRQSLACMHCMHSHPHITASFSKPQILLQISDFSFPWWTKENLCTYCAFSHCLTFHKKKSTFQIVDKSHKQIILSILSTFHIFFFFFFFCNFKWKKWELPLKLFCFFLNIFFFLWNYFSVDCLLLCLFFCLFCWKVIFFSFSFLLCKIVIQLAKKRATTDFVDKSKPAILWNKDKCAVFKNCSGQKSFFSSLLLQWCIN